MAENEKTKDAKHPPGPDTIIITGTALLPEDKAARDACRYVSIEIEVDPEDTTIIDVSCEILSVLGTEILCNALLGNKIEQGIHSAARQFETRFFGAQRSAVIAALEDAYRCYKKAKA